MPGDAFTWVGLALLAYQYGREQAAVILYVTHFIRIGIVAYLPFVTAEWQIYGLFFS